MTIELTNATHANAIVTYPAGHAAWPAEQRDLIRTTFANGASDAEFAALVAVAEARNLNPFTRQVFFVKRWDSQKRCETWAVQVSIDGLRAIAERTGLYAGQDEPEYAHDDTGAIVLCKVRVYRKDWGNRACVGVAYWGEYMQTTKEGRPTAMWAKFAHVMIAKCAEALALRKAFPEVASGLYTPDEIEASPPPRRQPSGSAELAVSSIEQSPAPAPSTMQALETDLQAIESPAEAVALWIKHRAEIGELATEHKEAAWKALVARAEIVGPKNARTWLKRAISDEDARQRIANYHADALVKIEASDTIEQLDNIADVIERDYKHTDCAPLWAAMDARGKAINDKRDFTALDKAILAMHETNGPRHCIDHYLIHVADLALEIDRYDYHKETARWLAEHYANDVGAREKAIAMISEMAAKREEKVAK